MAYPDTGQDRKHYPYSPIWTLWWRIRTRFWRNWSWGDNRPQIKFRVSYIEEVSKANSIVGLIRGSFAHLVWKLFKQLYTTFVRPDLEYAQAVCSSSSRKLINMLERSAQQNWLMDSAHSSMRSAWEGSSFQHLSTGVRVEIWLKFSSTSICMIKLWSQSSSNSNSTVSVKMVVNLCGEFRRTD